MLFQLFRLRRSRKGRDELPVSVSKPPRSYVMVRIFSVLSEGPSGTKAAGEGGLVAAETVRTLYLNISVSHSQ